MNHSVPIYFVNNALAVESSHAKCLKKYSNVMIVVVCVGIALFAQTCIIWFVESRAD